MSAAVNSKINRLRWKCRRGMLELDLILERVLAQYDSLTPAQQAEFDQLLDLDDPTLQAWLSGTEAPADKHADIVSLVRQLKRN